MTKDEIINYLIKQACFNEALANHAGETFDEDAIAMREAVELIKSMTKELEFTKRERDTWKRRAEVAVIYMNYIKGN